MAMTASIVAMIALATWFITLYVGVKRRQIIKLRIGSGNRIEP